jgi:hypothetical protein
MEKALTYKNPIKLPNGTALAPSFNESCVMLFGNLLSSDACNLDEPEGYPLCDDLVINIRFV